MNPGDLVKVAQRFSGNWGSDRAPVFDDSAALGLVTEIDRQMAIALVLIGERRAWVVLKNLEAINATR